MNSEAEARRYVARFADQRAIGKLEELVAALGSENEAQNLVARNTFDNVWNRHIADSAQLLELADEKAGPWLDLGSGAGFPGLVLAILRPDAAFHLVESRRRRIEWLERMARALKLENCTIHGMRLERVETFSAGAITARAFAPLGKLLDLSARFSTARTLWLLPKGRSAQQEVQGLDRCRRELFHVKQSKTDAKAGIIVGQGRMEVKR